MFGVTIVEGESVQSVLNMAADKLKNAETNYCYKNNFGISILQLVSKDNGFELGISAEASRLGPTGEYATAITSFLTGKFGSDRRIRTEGVNTNGSQVKLRKLAHTHKFWYAHLCRQIRRLLDGDEGAVNAIVYPLAKHTFEDNAYKPCPTYVQFQLHQASSSLSVVVNFRAQHLYMLGYNIQIWAFQLLQLCHEFQLPVGDVLLNCTNHHVWAGEDPTAVCGKPIPWFVKPNETSKLVGEVTEYYSNFQFTKGAG